MMEKRTGLGEFEQLVLAATIGGNGYGITIHEQVERILAGTARTASLGAVYTTLDRLEKKGYLRSWIGGETHKRGGRRMRFFVVQPSGRKAIESSLTVARNIFNAYERWLKLPVAGTPIYDTVTVPRGATRRTRHNTELMPTVFNQTKKPDRRLWGGGDKQYFERKRRKPHE